MWFAKALIVIGLDLFKDIIFLEIFFEAWPVSALQPVQIVCS